MINKIAVIGGGFFGCLISLKISEIDKIEVDLFEKKKRYFIRSIWKKSNESPLWISLPKIK